MRKTKKAEEKANKTKEEISREQQERMLELVRAIERKERHRRITSAISRWVPYSIGIMWLVISVLGSITKTENWMLASIIGSIWILIGAVSSK